MSSRTTAPAVEILLVEENPGDARLAAEGLKASRLRHRLQTVHDGHQALAFLSRVGDWRQAPRPDLILMATHLPGLGTRELLGLMRACPTCRQIPVLLLVDGDEPAPARPWGPPVRGRIARPADLEGLAAAVRQVEAYWAARPQAGVDAHRA